MLIGARVVMGVGAAASEPGTLSMIRQLYPDRGERAQALGVGGGPALLWRPGPVIGGALVGVWSWRAIFVFNIAAGVVALAGVMTILPSRQPRPAQAGSARVFPGGDRVIAGTFATIVGETTGYATWWIGVLFAVALGAALLFVLVERRAEEPVLDLRFFRERAFLGGNLVAFTGYFATFAVFFFVPLYRSAGRHDHPLTTWPSTSCRWGVMIVASALSGDGSPGSAPGCRWRRLLCCGVGILVTNAYINAHSGIALFGWSWSSSAPASA